MKTITINRKDLKNKNYNNAKIVEENDEKAINITNELTDFLFSCFKAIRENNHSPENSNDTLGFVVTMSKAIVKQSICLNIIIEKSDVESMKENIIKLVIKALIQVNRTYYTIEQFVLNIVDNKEDYLDSEIKTNCNKVVKVGV